MLLHKGSAVFLVPAVMALAVVRTKGGPSETRAIAAYVQTSPKLDNGQNKQ